MRLKRLYIGNMGIYRNALMEGIAPKIVVVGGLNRSGKTTLLEVLRHMPYGFSKNLRESKGEYYVESDFIDEQGETYTMRVSGLKEPEVSSANINKNISAKELYGDIDKFTYSQLYTITLDELRKSNIKAEEEKLQSVLLGAGLKDIIYIPKIIEEFRKEKEKIGGKLGSPNTKLFKNHYDKILDGVLQREEALQQLNEYNNKRIELKSLEQSIEKCEADIYKLQQNVIALEIVKAYYNQYNEKRTVEIQLETVENNDLQRYSNYPSIEKIETLKDDYVILYEEYSKAENNFKDKVSKDKSKYDKFIQYKSKIIVLQKQLSGYKERIDNYEALKSNYDRNKESIVIRMNSINDRWKGDFVKVLNLKCDSIEQDKLMSLVENLREFEDKKEQTQLDKDELISQKEIVADELKKIKSADSGIFIKKYLYISLSIFAGGVLLFLLNKALGSFLTLIGIFSITIYFFIKYSNINNSISRKKELVFQLETIENKEKILSKKLEEFKIELDMLNEKLRYYKDILNLQENVSPLGILQYFKDVQDLKRQIISLGYDGTKLEKMRESINSKLNEVKELMELFMDEELNISGNLLNHSSYVINKIEILGEQLQYAENLYDSGVKLSELGSKINNLLRIDKKEEELINALDKIIEQYKIYNYHKDLIQKSEVIKRQILQAINNENIKNALILTCKEKKFHCEDGFECFEKICSSFPSLEQISIQCLEHNDELKILSNTLEKLKEHRQAIKIDLKGLSTSQRLEQSQRIIDEGRTDLKSLALKYSVYSAAEYILENVQKNFINTTKDNLLNGASEILNKITGGKYKTVLPGDNLLQTDYKTIANDGEEKNSVNLLSRGTAEQLYLAVRINRIKDMMPKLPIILDDPFVNFDGIHTKNTLEVLSDLGEKNQIFILTCHADLVRVLSSIRADIQYWNLDGGRLSPCSSEMLINLLSNK